jgi:hypothetical protein
MINKLLIKFPTRNRPDVFMTTLDRYYENLSGEYEVEFLITLDDDDKSMQNQLMLDFLDSKKNLTYCFGNSNSKVQAVNADINHANTFDVLLLASDDMRPVIRGYDKIIIEKMRENFPDGDGVLHFNDSRTGQGLNTLCILGKKYYERFGYIYHSDYSSLWCDNEFHEVSLRLGKTVYIDQVIIKHDWVDVTGQDSLHKHNESFYHTDKRVFELRKRMDFPQESIGDKINLLNENRRRNKDRRKRNVSRSRRRS